MKELEKAKKEYPSLDIKGKELLKNIFGADNFKDNIMDRIKTMDDVYRELGIDKDKYENSFMFIESLYADKIRLITKVFNEGWEPNWKDSNEYKYTPYFKIDGCGFSGSDFCRWFTSGICSRLCFKSSELCMYAVKQFESDFENHYIIK